MMELCKYVAFVEIEFQTGKRFNRSVKKIKFIVQYLE